MTKLMLFLNSTALIAFSELDKIVIRSYLNIVSIMPSFDGLGLLRVNSLFTSNEIRYEYIFLLRSKWSKALFSPYLFHCLSKYLYFFQI